MKRIKIVLTVVIFFAILLITNSVQAKDYSIEEIDMKVILQNDGSLVINQTLKYNSEGSYNGIYITIPDGVDDSKYDEVRKQTSIVNDSFYNASSVQINKITVAGKEYTQKDYAQNGQSGIYTIERENDCKKVKIYSPISNGSKTFFVSYTLKNVAVRHKDIGEVYYNFIGGDWDKTIKKLNIDISLPANTSKDNLYAFAHGPYNGVVTIKDEKNINLYVENIEAGEYVAGRVLFDLSNITNSKKESNKIALNAIMQEEKNIYDKVEEKDRFNNKLLLLSVVLLVYWLILILKYENDKKYGASSNDEEMFNKYNPLIAGCIQGSRNVLSRDIIAVILDLVNKKYLKLEIVPRVEENNNILDTISNAFKEKEDYIYFIEINEESNYVPDEIEDYIVRWLQRESVLSYNSNENKRSIDLLQTLEKLPKSKIANQKFKELDEMAMKKLNEIGANKAKVPMILRVLNVFLFILTVILSIINIDNILGKSESVYAEIILEGTFILLWLAPIVMYLLIIPIKLLSLARKSINKIVQKVSGQKVVFTSIAIILVFMLIMILTAIFIKNKYLLVNEFLICVGTLIMLTDNLMLKNDPIIAEDYSRLNSLKYKIENYSMMEDKEIKEVVLWEKYLTYAISFGLASKIAGKIKVMINDEDLTKILESRSFYDYVVNDYSYFNMRMTSVAVDKMVKTANRMASSRGGFSGGRGGGFSGGGSRGRRRRQRPEEAELFKYRKYEIIED